MILRGVSTPWAPISVLLADSGGGGAPGTTIDQIVYGVTSYQHTIVDTGGFESCTVQATVPRQQAEVITDLIGGALFAYGAKGDRYWEGQIYAIELATGGQLRRLSLEQLFNRVRVRYTLRGLQTPHVTAAASDSSSVAAYGTKDMVISAGVTDSAGATGLRDEFLAAHRALKSDGGASLALAGLPNGEPVTITIYAQGWYYTLDWVVLERTDTTQEETIAQLASLLGTSTPGIGATNAFLKPSTGRCRATGVTTSRAIATDTPYRAAIEQRLQMGTSAGERFSWGVYQDRFFEADTWAGATPDTFDYAVRPDYQLIEHAGSGGHVPFGLVRPNTMLFNRAAPTRGALPTVGADNRDRFYVGRVTFGQTLDGQTLELEPSDTTSIDAKLARMGA